MELKTNIFFVKEKGKPEELTVRFRLEPTLSKEEKICNFCGNKRKLFEHRIEINEIISNYANKTSIDLKNKIKEEICKIMEIDHISSCELCSKKDRDFEAYQNAIKKLNLE